MREWKYRFKRGLASFLTVGMIASGVGTATCLPVYAATTAASTAKEEDVNKAVQQVTDGLRGQILDLFNQEGTGEAKFTVPISFRSKTVSESNDFVKDIVNKANDILETLLEKYPSELFWYDSNNKCMEVGKRERKGDVVTANVEFQLAVKEIYRVDGTNSETSINIDKIKDIHREAGPDELNSAIEDIRAQLQEQISKTANGKEQANTNYIVHTACKNRSMSVKLINEAPNIRAWICDNCSTDLFWYDKGTSNPNELSPNYLGEDVGEIYLTFNFLVKKEYRDNPDKPYSINLQEVANVKEKMNEIFSGAEGEGLSDYDILRRYSDALCDKYGKKPNDQLTAAFQYFCNHANFSSSETKCYTVEGTVDGKQRSWNIVCIDGNNYLVDLVRHASGRDGQYFLVGARPIDGGYELDNDTKYIPNDKNSQKPTSFKEYKPQQALVVSGPIRGTAGEGGALVIKVEGNIGAVRFIGSDPALITIETKKELGNNVALVYLNDMGADHTRGSQQYIYVEAAETTGYAFTRKEHPLWVDPPKNHNNSGNQPPVVNPGNPGGNTGNTGGSSSGIGFGGGNTGGSGGSCRIGSVAVGEDSASKGLLPQTDFGINSGSSIILKSVGDEDFTITASGEVKDSKITYSSSDPSVATVDVNTGTVHIVGPGTVTISATASQTDLHRAEKCEYKVEVS